MNSTRRTAFGEEASTLDQVQLGVAVIVSDSKHRLLLEKRADCGLWGLPGGRVEPNETVTQSAVREVFEETGLQVQITGLIGVYSDPQDKRLVTYPGEAHAVHIVDVVMSGEVFSGELKCSPESEEIHFFDPGDLPKELVPPAIAPLEDYLRRQAGVIR